MKTIHNTVTATRSLLLVTFVLMVTGCGSMDPNFQLRKATRAGDSAKVQQLIAAGADVNYRGPLEKTPPVFEAASRNDATTLEILLDHGASVNDRIDSSGWTPLHSAAANNGLASARLLLGRGATIDAVDKDEHTPLYLAVQSGHKEMAELLINAGGGVNMRDRYGNSPLSAAIMNRNKELVALLNSAGAVTSNKDSYVLAAEDRGLYFHLNTEELGMGYQINPRLAIEGGVYAPLSSSSDSDGCVSGFSCIQEDYSASFNQIAAVLALPVSNLIDHGEILLKLAMADVSVDYSYSSTGCFLFICGATGTGTGSGSKIGPAYGIGWRNCGRILCFRVQYEDFGSVEVTRIFSGKPDDTVSHRVTSFMVGLMLYFN